MEDRPEPAEPDEVVRKRLHVRAGDRRLALPIDVVAEVGSPGPVVPVPHGAEWLAGVTQWRGRLLTLVDAGLLFGLRRSGGAKLVVLRNLNVETALAVDQVIGTEEDDAAADVLLETARLRTHPALQPGAAVVLGHGGGRA